MGLSCIETNWFNVMQLSPHERVKPIFLPYTEAVWGCGQGYVGSAEPAPAKLHEAQLHLKMPSV